MRAREDIPPDQVVALAAYLMICLARAKPILVTAGKRKRLNLNTDAEAARLPGDSMKFLVTFWNQAESPARASAERPRVYSTNFSKVERGKCRTDQIIFSIVGCA